MRGVFLAIVGELIANHSRQATVGLSGGWAACGSIHDWERAQKQDVDERKSRRLRMPHPVCESTHCPYGVNLTFVRSDHLDVENATYNAGDAQQMRTCADESALRWMSLLEQEAQLLVISRGTHVEEYKSVHGRDVRGDAAWHAERARLLASQLRDKPTQGILYLRPHWGVAEYSDEPRHGKLADRREHPHPVSTRYSWHLLPMMGEVTATQLRKGLGDQVLVIDPTLALEQRPDCRLDPLHIRPEVLVGSVLRLLVAGLSHWHWQRENSAYPLDP